MSSGNAFGSLIAEAQVDLTKFRQDLRDAVAESKRAQEEINRNLRTTANISGGGSGGRSSTSSGRFVGTPAEGRRMGIPPDVMTQLRLKRYLDTEEMKGVRMIQAARREEFNEERLQMRGRLDMQQQFAARRRQADQEERMQVGARLTMQRDFEKRAVAAKKLADEARKNSLGGRFGASFQKFNEGNLKSITEEARNFVNTLASVGSAAVIGGVAAYAKYAIEIEQVYQRNKITIAEILTLTTELTDAQGKATSGVHQMAVNYQLADKMIQQVRKEAVRTVLTTDELLQNTTQGLGYALAAGAKPNEAVSLIARISNLAKSLGAHTQREQGFEVRAMLTGQMVPRSRLGRVLGMDSATIKEHLKDGDLVDFLNKKLAAGKPFLDAYARSYQGLVTTIQSKGWQFTHLAFEGVFEKITKRLGDLNKYLSEGQIEHWAKRFSEGFMNAYEALENFVKSDAFKNIAGFFQYLITHAGTIAGLFGAWKGVQVGSAAAAVLGNMSKGKEGAGVLPLLPGAAAFGRAGIAGLGIAAAGLTGYGIGTLANNPFGALGYQATADRELGGKEADLREQRSNPLIANLLDAKQRKARSRTEYQGAVDRFGANSLDASIKRYALNQAVDLEAQAQQAITKARETNSKRRIEIDAEEGRRHSKLLAERLRADREAAEQERVEVAKKIADLKNDKVGALRAQAELDIREATIGKKQINDPGRRNAYIATVRAGLHKDVVVAKYDQAFERAGIAADSTGNDMQKIRIDAGKSIVARYKEEGPGAEFAHQRAELMQGMYRTLADKEREYQQKVKDEVHESRAVWRDLAHTRIEMEKEVLDLERRTAREARTLVRERIDAERELKRAQEDRIFRIKELDQSKAERGLTRQAESYIRANFGGAIGGTGGIGFADSYGGSGLLKHGDVSLASPYGPGFQAGDASNRQYLAGAANREIRNLGRELAQPGGYESVQKRLQELVGAGGGRITQEGFAGLARFGTKAFDLETQADQTTEARAGQEDTRGREDADRSVTDSSRRISELNVRQAELIDGYKTAAAVLKDRFKKELEDTTDKVTKMGVEIGKLLLELNANHIAISPQQRAALAAGVNAGGHAGGAVGNALAPTYNFVFHDGSLKNIGGDAKLYLQKFADALEKDALRTPPSRR